MKSCETLVSNIPQKPATPRLEWASKIIGKLNTYQYTTPSPLYTWYVCEKEKQRLGLQNEIDIADIKAAFRGFRNKWFERVSKNREIFLPVFNEHEFDWEKIKSIK